MLTPVVSVALVKALHKADLVTTRNPWPPAYDLPGSKQLQDKERFGGKQVSRAEQARLTAESSVSVSTMVKTRNTEDTVIKTKALKKIQDQLKDYKNLEKEYEKLEDELEKVEGKLEKANDKHADEIKVKDGMIERLRQRIEELSNALRSAGKDVLAINKELAKEVMEMMELYLQRNWKFMEDDQDLVQATRDVIPYLPNALTMSDEDFVANYQEAVNKGLKNNRQNVQSECKKRAEGTQKIGFVTRFSLFLHRIFCFYLQLPLFFTQNFGKNTILSQRLMIFLQCTR